MSIDDIAKRRDEQFKRVIAALGFMEPKRAVSIILMWMSIDDVEAMLKTLESQDEGRNEHARDDPVRRGRAR